MRPHPRPGTAAVLAALATATPAQAATVSQGQFVYTSRTGLCVETYAGTQLGTGGCFVSLQVGDFLFRVVHDQDGTCSGVARAVLFVDSPTLDPPAAYGFLVVSHSTGTFAGTGSSALAATVADATLTGSVCRPQDVLGSEQTLTGTYEAAR